MKENSAALHVQLPIATATFLLNEKRHEINALESKMGTPIVIVPSAEMDTPHFRIRRLRDEEFESLTGKPSYKIEVEEEIDTEAPVPAQQKTETAAVGQLVHTETAPPRRAAPTVGIFVRLFRWLFGTGKKPKVKTAQRSGARRNQRNRGRSGPQARRGQPQRNRGQQRKRNKSEDRQQNQQGQQAKSEQQASDEKKKGGSSRERPRGRRRPNKGRSQPRNTEQKGANSGANPAANPAPESKQSDKHSSSAPEAPRSVPDNIGNVARTETATSGSGSASWQQKNEPNGNFKPASESSRSSENKGLQQVETRSED